MPARCWRVVACSVLTGCTRSHRPANLADVTKAHADDAVCCTVRERDRQAVPSAVDMCRWTVVTFSAALTVYFTQVNVCIDLWWAVYGSLLLCLYFYESERWQCFIRVTGVSVSMTCYCLRAYFDIIYTHLWRVHHSVESAPATFTLYRHPNQYVLITIILILVAWLIEYGLTSHQTHYRLILVA